MATGAMTSWDAVSILLGLGGSTGVGGCILAYFAYRAAAASGRRGEPEKAAGLNGIVGGIVDRQQFDDYLKVADKFAIALNKHADALNRQHEVRTTNALEKMADRVDELLAQQPHRRK